MVDAALLTHYGIGQQGERYYVARQTDASRALCMLCGDEIKDVDAFIQVAEHDTPAPQMDGGEAVTQAPIG